MQHNVLKAIIQTNQVPMLKNVGMFADEKSEWAVAVYTVTALD